VGPPTREESRPYLNLDLTDQKHSALSSYAGRIGKLLKAPAVPPNPDLAGSLDDFLGAVYALILAKQHVPHCTKSWRWWMLFATVVSANANSPNKN